jgi:indolepyruvate ferredoxin oxidoreductase beta subunit
MKEFNVVLAGVGGQGALLSSEILGTAALNDGLNVRVGEIHGMAQRGGSVVSTLRIGEVAAPTVLEGQADVLLGFEPLETLRSIKYASRKTLVITSVDPIPPAFLTAKKMKYPSMKEIEQKIRLFTRKIILVETMRLAREAGSSMAQNTVLLGALAASGRLPFKTDRLLEALKELVPAKYLETNVRAFNLGYNSAKRDGKEN